MKVLVTGGAGYIGSHTCKCLALHGHEVVVYDNLSTGFRDVVRWGCFEHGDIRDRDRLREVMLRHMPDGVIHFAASINVGESVNAPGKYYDNNVYGTLCLLSCMRECCINNIVVSGTCAVYGIPDTVPISESCPVAPINPYGVTKMVMERMLQDFRTAHGLSWASLRYFNAAGADTDVQTGERHDPETHLIPRVLMAAVGDIPALELYGDDYPTKDGTCVRDYIHVEDLALAHIAALEHLNKEPDGLALNLGTGRGYTVLEIIRAAELITGLTVPYKIAPRRPGDSDSLVADASLAMHILGWRAEHSSIERIVETAWRWFQATRGC